MNFKTTILLVIVLLILVGGYFFGTRQSAEPAAPTDQDRVVKLQDSDVKTISITPPGGQAVVMERTDGGEWNITAPVTAKAEKWTVEDLVGSLTSLNSRGKTDVKDADRSALGLDDPTRVVLTDKDGKKIELAFGSRSAVGDSTYVQTGDSKSAEVVAADILEKLDEPLKKYRSTSLADVSSSDVKQFVLTRPEDTLEVEKRDSKWVMKSPEQMPLETFQVMDIVSTMSNLRANEFVAEEASDLAKYGLDKPRYSLKLSTDAPATQPSDPAPSYTEIRLGSYDDIRRQNVFAMVGDSGPIAKVSATVINTLAKKPLEMRARDVLEIDPDTVNSISISTLIPATTQPTTREASESSLMVVRNEAAELQGPPAPATGPATTQATTQATTEPAAPPAWLFADSNEGADADKVKKLLDELKPLRASRFIEKMPDTAVSKTHRVTIRTVAAGGQSATHELTITEFDSGSPVVHFQELLFEISRSFLDALKLR